ncbi:MAG TPA: ice-binding family protein [Thermoanaerobaculia bacterium]|nr:ice-binding family protein [Thermoanaerobaculia bacterium]
MKQKLLGIFALLAVVLAFAPASAFAQVPLGTSNTFGVLGGSTVTNTGATAVNGNVGVSPGTEVTGFPPGVVVGGVIHAGNATAAQAQTDLTAAYNFAVSIACTANLTGQDLGTQTLTPGVYCFDSSAGLTGILTLDLQGDPNAFFLFKMGSTLTTASGSSVVLANSGGTTCPQNINWQVGSSATFGTNSAFIGNVLALTSITLTTNANLNGRALARNGAVTLDSNVITPCGALVPGPPAPPVPPAIPALDFLGLAILIAILGAAGLFVMNRGA